MGPPLLYKGDIYTVPVAGGRAMQITTNPAYDTAPVWSPDSKRIAFASDRMGSLDVYIVAKDGGEPRRLTTHSGSETPLAFTIFAMVSRVIRTPPLCLRFHHALIGMSSLI